MQKEHVGAEKVLVSKLITMGDSHCEGRFGWTEVAHHFGLHHEQWYSGPTTLHTLIEDLGDKPWNVLTNIPGASKLASGDFFVVCCGEIDIRCHSVKVAKSMGVSLEKYGQKLAIRAGRFVQQLIHDAREHVDIHVAIYAPPPPLDVAWDTGEKNYVTYDEMMEVYNKITRGETDINPHSLNVGPPEERLKAHTAYVKTLKAMNVPVIDINKHLVNENGYLARPNDLTDSCHVLTGRFFIEWMMENWTKPAS